MSDTTSDNNSNIIEYKIKVKKSRTYDFFKRVFDIFSSLIFIIVFSWLFLILWLLVKLTSKGPGIYKSTRVGKNGKEFDFYKFRSMVDGAEAMKKDLLEQNEIKGGVYFKMENDPRITKVGKFLRKTSLDELPQFFNVLKGDLSLVGPRACIPDEYAQMTEYQKQRTLVKQGITGLWQVKARSSVENFDDVVKYDLDYIQNKRGFFYDLYLCFMTVVVVIKGKGAE